MLIRVANTITCVYGPSFEPLGKNEDEVAIRQKRRSPEYAATRSWYHPLLWRSWRWRKPQEQYYLEVLQIRKDMNQAKTL